MNRKAPIYTEIAVLVKALGHPTRLEILELLGQRAWSVEELADAIGIPIANCSRHLQQLRDARLVVAERRGLFVHYSLAGDDVADVHTALIRLAENRLAEVERLMRSDADDAAPSVSTVELRRLISRRTVVLLDVRPRAEFEAAHLADALSVPLAELRTAYRKLPKDKTVVAYCRGPVCALAAEAVRFLRSKGFEAYGYDESVRDSRLRGLAVRSHDP
jgi:rhodanese-related sulfurtransferase/DNA-binding transcriptional ArsR family regulator